MDAKPFPKSLIEAVRYFEDPDVCRGFVVSLRWPNGVTCPRERCGSDRLAFIESRKVRRCNGCRKHVAPWSTVYTDALPSYGGLAGEYVHGVLGSHLRVRERAGEQGQP